MSKKPWESARYADGMMGKEKVPFWQWANTGDKFDPRMPTGGFFMGKTSLIRQYRGMFGSAEPTKKLSEMGGEIYPLNAQPTSMYFSDQGHEKGICATELTVVIAAYRFSWVKGMGRDRTFPQVWEEGARGRRQLMVYTEVSAGVWIGPQMLTLTGLITKDMGAILKEHKKWVDRVTSETAPMLAFRVVLKVGETKMRGGDKQSMATTMVRGTPPDDPADAYVGQALIDRISANWGDLMSWAKEWRNDDDPALRPDGDNGEAADEYQESRTHIDQPPTEHIPEKPDMRKRARRFVDNQAVVLVKNNFSATRHRLDQAAIFLTDANLPQWNDGWDERQGAVAAGLLAKMLKAIAEDKIDEVIALTNYVAELGTQLAMLGE